jgi:hypothetical protein
MNGPNETGMDNAIGWGVLATLGAVAVAFTKRMNPLVPIQWLAAAVNGPVLEKHFEKSAAHFNRRFDGLEVKVDAQGGKIDKVCRVIDHMDGAEKAHAAVRAEDERWKV